MYGVIQNKIPQHENRDISEMCECQCQCRRKCI